MKMTMRMLMLCGVMLVTACASLDNRDRYLLGEATSRNITEQSIRDVTVPNSEASQSSSGVRAANAVRALNEGKNRDLPSSGASAGSGTGGESL